MKTLLAALTVLFASVASVASAQVAVVAPHPINLEPEKAQAFTAICAQAYREASGQPALTAETVDAAKALGVTELIELNLIGLDGAKTRKVLVNGVRKTAAGQPLHEVNIEALSMEDAPTVCARLATALVNKQAIEATQTRTTVTATEASKRSRRLAANHSLGVKTGLTVPFAANGGLAPMGSLAFDARFETERWFYETGVGFLIPAVTGSGPGYGGITADLGANYFLTDTDFAPYVGLGVQPRLVFSGAIFNLVPYAQVGATLSRKSSVRLFADVRVGQNVLPALTGVYPTEVNVNVGLGF